MWNLIARLLLAVERSIERQLQPALSGRVFLVKVFSLFVCTFVLVPAMAVAAQAKLFHPVFIVITEQLASDKPQQAVVQPWFLTDGSRIVWINTLCAAIAEGRRPPIEARQLLAEVAK